MAHIEIRPLKNGTASYRAHVILKGHPRVSATFRRKTDAKRWAQITEAAIRERRYFPGSEAERHTVGDLVRRFIDEKLSLRSARDRGRLASQLDWWVGKLGKETKLANLSPALIVQARDRLTAGDTISGRPAAPATVKRYLAILARMLSVAEKEWFWITDNPCRRVPRPSEPRGRVRYLSEDERASLLEACRSSTDSRLFLLVLLALATGARQGEILGLRWRDLDLTKGVAILHHTKNDDRRSVPITGVALEVLRERSACRHLPSDYVFVGTKRTVLFPRKAWDRALTAAVIEDFTFHDLRHTAASYLAMSGATLAEIAEILGHKTLAMVKRYAHLSDSHTRSVVERMTGRFL